MVDISGVIVYLKRLSSKETNTMQVIYTNSHNQLLATYYKDGRLALIDSAWSYFAFFIIVIMPAYIRTVPSRLGAVWDALSREHAATVAVLAVMLIFVFGNFGLFLTSLAC